MLYIWERCDKYRNTVIVAYIDTICNPYGKHICINTIWVPYDIAIWAIAPVTSEYPETNLKLFALHSFSTSVHHLMNCGPSLRIASSILFMIQCAELLDMPNLSQFLYSCCHFPGRVGWAKWPSLRDKVYYVKTVLDIIVTYNT